MGREAEEHVPSPLVDQMCHSLQLSSILLTVTSNRRACSDFSLHDDVRSATMGIMTRVFALILRGSRITKLRPPTTGSELMSEGHAIWINGNVRIEGERVRSSNGKEGMLIRGQK